MTFTVLHKFLNLTPLISGQNQNRPTLGLYEQRAALVLSYREKKKKKLPLSPAALSPSSICSATHNGSWEM